ncbi:MAG: nucleotidyltransferase domain-containing protein [Candidatus Eremiobacteraeota bacterium]|nr:nucleotidyltransferase domain-containing protein [Candidatus Eremiobacteraeota bacterium]
MKAIDDILLNEIVKRILSLAKPEKIVLFGSYARGDAVEDSDIDILVIQESGIPRYKRGVPIRLALKGLFLSKDIVVYTPEEVEEWSSVPYAFITTILREGKVLYAKEQQ